MNDFEAPQLDDTAPPRLYNTVRASAVNYNMDFVCYLVAQETQRRIDRGDPLMTPQQHMEFQKELVRKVIIQGDVEGAIALRPANLPL